MRDANNAASQPETASKRYETSGFIAPAVQKETPDLQASDGLNSRESGSVLDTRWPDADSEVRWPAALVVLIVAGLMAWVMW